MKILSMILAFVDRLRAPTPVHANTLNGMGLRTVEAKTASYTVVRSTDNGKVFTNAGAAGAVTFSLPAATVGQWYSFVVKAAQELRIDPNGTQTISLPTGVQQAAGKYITADAVGERVDVECVVAGVWETKSAVGTWTAEA